MPSRPLSSAAACVPQSEDAMAPSNHLPKFRIALLFGAAPSSVRFDVAFCQVDIEGFDQVPIDQPVLARDLCRRAAGHLASDPLRFEHSNR
jgi:hypothetical protein